MTDAKMKWAFGLLLAPLLFLGSKAGAVRFPSSSSSGSSLTAGSTAVSGGTQGSVLFVTTSSVLGQKNSQFFWDEPNGRLVLGGGGLFTGVLVKNPAGTQVSYLYMDGNSHGLLELANSAGATKIYLNGGAASYINNGQNFGLGTASPSTLFHMSSGTLTIDGTGGAISLRGMTVSSQVVTEKFGFLLNGGGAAITTGLKGEAATEVPANMTVTKWEVVASTVAGTGSIAVDIWCDTYANWPPTVADTITGSEPPTITTSNSGTDTSLTSFDTALEGGLICVPVVTSASTLQDARVTIWGYRTQ